MSEPLSRPVVYRVAVPVPLPGLFDYLPGDAGTGLRPGQRVRVAFGPRKLVGVIVEQVSEPSVALDRLQPLLGVLDDGQAVLTKELLGPVAMVRAVLQTSARRSAVQRLATGAAQI